MRNHVSLATQVTGSVVSIAPAMRAGGTFRAGEELLAIDPRDFRLAVEQAQADIEVAQSGVLLEQARSDAARSNYAILHPDKEVPSLVARLPQIAQAKAQRAAARARLRVAELSLERTVFSLPFDGSIVQSNAEVGQVLTRGQPFGRAFAHDAVEVVALLAPDDLKRIEPATGRQATVDDQNRRLAAVVERTSAELDARTRFAELYLRIDGTPPTPGTFVDVEIQGPALANTFLLPDATEQVNGDAWIVADGKLEASSGWLCSGAPGAAGSFAPSTSAAASWSVRYPAQCRVRRWKSTHPARPSAHRGTRERGQRGGSRAASTGRGRLWLHPNTSPTIPSPPT